MITQAIQIEPNLLAEANKYASVFSRTVSKQVEHWVRIGKTAEENPDLSYDFIKDTLLALEEAKSGPLAEYQFG
ncbi:MAG: hypothetical protein Ta2A_27350 [Treponemataceae bacterium]|nr:MAG: hypothetical protein Ta2A_27350 [Treponemataceae bacterium]